MITYPNPSATILSNSKPDESSHGVTPDQSPAISTSGVNRFEMSGIVSGDVPRPRTVDWPPRTESYCWS